MKFTRLVAVMVIFAGCIEAGHGFPGFKASCQAQTNPDQSDIAGKLAMAVQLVAEKENFSGVVLARLKGKTVARIAVGKRDVKNGLPNTPDTLFEIASVTKSVTAVAVMVLQQQGKLRLDDSISGWLPGVPENCNSITIRHLLQHTSGIPGTNYGPYSNDISEVAPVCLRGGPQHEPGSHFEYWNQGYALLSAIIAKASGEEYPQAMKSLVFEPAGMKAACFTGDSPVGREEVAIGQSLRGAARSALEPPYGEDYGLQYQGMGGLVCTADDLLNLLMALGDDSLLLGRGAVEELLERPATVVEATSSEDNAAESSWYALGFKVENVSESQRRVFHTGGVRGFTASLAWYPGDDSALIVLANSDASHAMFAVENACRVLLERQFVQAPDNVPDSVPDNRRFDSAWVDQLVGRYELGQRTLQVDAKGEAVSILLDWGGPRTGGWLEKGEGTKLSFQTLAGESLDFLPAPPADGKVPSIRLMEQDYKRK